MLKFIFKYAGMVNRIIAQDYSASLEEFPVTGIIGPRQVGKTTMVKQCRSQHNTIYLDLERNSDLNKLSDPELFLAQHIDKTVILDKVNFIVTIH